jgi:hypothetical protein
MMLQQHQQLQGAGPKRFHGQLEQRDGKKVRR